MSDQQQGEQQHKWVWVVTFKLEVAPFDLIGLAKLWSAPDANFFRIPFATKDEACRFRAEQQRYLGSLLMSIADGVTLLQNAQKIKGQS